MDFQVGELIEFTIAESDKRNYVEWFRYAVQTRSVGRITHIENDSSRVRCVLVDPNKNLIQMKPGGNNVYTEITTIKKISAKIYEEI